MEDWMNQPLEVEYKNPVTQDQIRSFFAGVYSYMFLGLLVSGFVAYYLASTGLFIEWFVTETGVSPLFYVVAFSPLAFILFMNMKFQTLSKGTLIFLFIVFSSLMGASFSSIFFVYAMGSIISTFFITAAAFGAMAILGYTTSVDLSKMGSLLYMVFIGIFIASIVNMFMKSDGMSYVISIIGVFVFTGLTAWEMQKLKAMASDTSIDNETRDKLSLIGGMSLYILFVNLFLSLLRLLGSRD